MVFEPVVELGRTYAVRQPVGGPRIRLAVMWVLVLALAFVSESTAVVAIVFGAVGALAAAQVARSWRSRRVPVNPAVAGWGVAVLAFGAWISNRSVAAALLCVVVGALVLGTGTDLDLSAFRLGRLRRSLPTAAATLRSGLLVGLAVAAVVQVHRIDPLAWMFLVGVVCVYDAGDYLVGAGVAKRWIGPLAGVLGALVVVGAMVAVKPAPFSDAGDIRLVGALMAIGCPLGQMLGSWMLPSSRVKAPALRRMDSWLVAAPVMYASLHLLGLAGTTT